MIKKIVILTSIIVTALFCVTLAVSYHYFYPMYNFYEEYFETLATDSKVADTKWSSEDGKCTLSFPANNSEIEPYGSHNGEALFNAFFEIEGKCYVAKVHFDAKTIELYPIEQYTSQMTAFGYFDSYEETIQIDIKKSVNSDIGGAYYLNKKQ